MRPGLSALAALTLSVGAAAASTQPISGAAASSSPTAECTGGTGQKKTRWVPPIPPKVADSSVNVICTQALDPPPPAPPVQLVAASACCSTSAPEQVSPQKKPDETAPIGLVPPWLRGSVLALAVLTAFILAYAALRVLGRALRLRWVRSGTSTASSMDPAAVEGFSLTSVWGGFGGGRTGWSLSPRLAELLVALSLAALSAWIAATVVALPSLRESEPPEQTPPAAQEPAASEPAAKKP